MHYKKKKLPITMYCLTNGKLIYTLHGNCIQKRLNVFSKVPLKLDRIYLQTKQIPISELTSYTLVLFKK